MVGDVERSLGGSNLFLEEFKGYFAVVEGLAGGHEELLVLVLEGVGVGQDLLVD